MSRRATLLTPVVLALLTACQTHPLARPAPAAASGTRVQTRADPPPGRPAALAGYGTLPLHFEANRGQFDNPVDFVARGRGYTLFLTPTEAVLVLRQPKAPRRDAGAPGRPVVRMTLSGANPAPRAAGLEELPTRVNYFVGREPARWRTDVPTYAKVQYPGVYPGVDLVYYGHQGRLEYDFVVAPGADPGVIGLAFEGADHVRLTDDGDLVMSTAHGELRMHRPRVYQEIDGTRVAVEARFSLVEETCGGAACARFRVGVQVAAYDAGRPLVVDPVLVYSTYLGGTGDEEAIGVAVDASGSVYVTGTTDSTDFPTVNPVQPAFGGGIEDAFVVKLNPAGSALVYATYLGGSGVDAGHAITVDAAGNAYVIGRTNSMSPVPFPTTAGAFQTFLGGLFDGFVAKLGPTGSTLVYATYLGGSGNDNTDDFASGIAVDAAGNAYVTGLTVSANFPTTAGAFQTVSGGGSDAYVTKLNPAGSALVYSTYLGGSGTDAGNGIAIDGAGNAYVAGRTNSVNFPTTVGAFQTSLGGLEDGFVAKLNPAGSARVYATYLGGSSTDHAREIAVDATGNAYLVGFTFSANFPTTVGALQPAYNGGGDGWVAKLNPAGSAPLVYSTYLGGTGNDSARSIAVNPAGNAYVTGRTGSANFPIANAFQPTLASPSFDDAFVTKLNPTGSGLVYSTYLGGTGDDHARAVAVDGAGSAYVVGQTSSTDFPTASPLQPASAGLSDVFVAKIATDADLSVVKIDTPDPVAVGNLLTYAITVTNSGPVPASGTTLTDVLPGTVTFVSATPTQGSCSGTTTVTCTLGSLGVGASATVTITVTPGTAGPLTNTASVSGNEPDPNPANNNSSTTTTVAPASATVILTLMKAGSGTGTVTLTPLALACDAVCVGVALRLPGGSPATLTATADPGAVFLGWTGGGCPATASCLLPLLADTTVVATFGRPVALATGTGPGGGPHVEGFGPDGQAAGPGFMAYDQAFRGGVFVALGAVDGAGLPRVVTGAGPGGGSHVRVFDVDGTAFGPGFLAYDPSFRGGVRVAACDLDGDGHAEIVTAPGPGGGPHIRVFADGAGVPTELLGFLAYDPNFRGGVYVACADVNGDGRPDIVTGADAGAAPHVRVFSIDLGPPATVTELTGFYAYDPLFTGGVRVAAADVDGDGRADIVTGPGPGTPALVRVLSGATGAELAALLAYPAAFTGGVLVAAGRPTGVAPAAFATGPGTGWAPHVRVFALPLVERASFFAYGPSFLGGVTVAVRP